MFSHGELNDCINWLTFHKEISKQNDIIDINGYHNILQSCKETSKEKNNDY